MENKKLALYYGVDKEVIGVRECLQGWREGDVIITDGAKTEVYAVFDSTMKNMMVMAQMFMTLNTKSSMWCMKGFIENPCDEDELMDDEDLIEYLDFVDLLTVLVCNQYTVKKRVWPEYDKRLDYMEECVELIA